MPADDPFLRYHRQMLVDGVGRQGQERLRRAHAVIVGCGALGCTSAQVLARAGIGRITVIDRDLVEATNLQRQILFDERDLAEPKAVAAAEHLRAINSEIEVEGIVADARFDTIERLCGITGNARPRADILLDGTDNYETRYLLNDLAVRDTIPFLYAGAVRTRAMSLAVIPGSTPCLRCIFEQPPTAGDPETCDTVGILAPAAVVAASIQTAQAIRILVGDPPAPALIEMDLWDGSQRRIDLSAARRDDCPCCACREFPFLSGEHAADVAHLCGQDAYSVVGTQRVDLSALAERLREQGKFSVTRFLVRGTLAHEVGAHGQPIELTVFGDGRTIVAHARDADHARSIAARFVGH